MFDCSEKLRLLREAKNLTQQQVADKIGISKAMISAYETSSKSPSVEMLIRLSRLFGVSIDYLVCLDAPKYLDVSGLDDEAVTLLATLAKKLKQKPQF